MLNSDTNRAHWARRCNVPFAMKCLERVFSNAAKGIRCAINAMERYRINNVHNVAVITWAREITFWKK